MLPDAKRIMEAANKLLRKFSMREIDSGNVVLNSEERKLLEDRNIIVCGSLKRYNKELHEQYPHPV